MKSATVVLSFMILLKIGKSFKRVGELTKAPKTDRYAE